MKLFIKIAFLSLCVFTMHAEFLVLKQTDTGFAALNGDDVVNKAAIADIFLKYQWPMVISNSSLTEEEQNELLTSDLPYAEEKFIRKKLKEINQDYDVIFIPTSLYELFMCSDLISIIHKEFKVFVKAQRIECAEALNIMNQPSGVVCEKVYQEYRDANNLFYPDAFFYGNNTFVNFLFDTYPALQSNENSVILSEQIKLLVYEIAALLIPKFVLSDRKNTLIFVTTQR